MGWGSSKGWWLKSSCPPSKVVRALPRKFVFLGFRREEPGMSREFCRDVPDPANVRKVSLCALDKADSCSSSDDEV